MKGLLYKDLVLSWKTNKLCIGMMMLFFALFAIEKNGMLILFQTGVLMALSVCFMLFSYDERISWQAYCHTTPILRRKYVWSRYLFLLFLVGFSAVLFLVTQLPLWFFTKSIDGALLIYCFTILVSLILIVMSVVFPLIFAFGAAKGRLLYLIVVGAYYAMVAIMEIKTDVSSPIFPLAVMLISALCFVVSLVISVCIYERKTAIV